MIYDLGFMVYDLGFMVYDLGFMVYDLGCKVLQGCFTGRRKPKILQRLARGEGFLQGLHFPDSHQGGGVDIRPPTVQTRASSKVVR